MPNLLSLFLPSFMSVVLVKCEKEVEAGFEASDSCDSKYISVLKIAGLELPHFLTSQTCLGKKMLRSTKHAFYDLLDGCWRQAQILFVTGQFQQ